MNKKVSKLMTPKDKPHPMLHGHLGKESQNWLTGKLANPLVKKKSTLSKTLKKLK
jgi:hypothetical protein